SRLPGTTCFILWLFSFPGLETNHGFNHYTVELCASQALVSPLTTILLLNIFDFGQDIFCEEPPCTEVQSVDLKGALHCFSGLSRYGIVFATYIKSLSRTEAV